MTSTHTAASATSDLALLDDLARAHEQLIAQIGRRIVGQHEVVNNIVAALLSGGHALLDGRAGAREDAARAARVAESLNSPSSASNSPRTSCRATSRARRSRRRRPTGPARFEFVRGPIFANIVLADEINRTPPKTQAALLQAMQEQR